MRKAAKEDRLNVKGCKLQVEKSGAAVGKQPSTFNLQPSTFPTWLLALLLALATVALYWPAMRCDFINLDDEDYVTGNVHVQSGLTWEASNGHFSNPVAVRIGIP